MQMVMQYAGAGTIFPLSCVRGKLFLLHNVEKIQITNFLSISISKCGKNLYSGNILQYFSYLTCFTAVAYFICSKLCTDQVLAKNLKIQ